MINLSYTTMNALIHEPHTWVNKQMGLKTKQFVKFEDGHTMHKIVQEHCSGVKLNEFLGDLPEFPIVEKVDFDPRCKIEMPLEGKYAFVGYVDGLNPDKKEILEIKSGRRWSVGDFQKLVQWKLYALALKDYKKIWLVNVPKTEDLMMAETVRVFNKTITPKDLVDAENFIKKAIYTIEHIKEQTLHVEKRSNWCYYIDCSFCPKEEYVSQ